MFFFKRKKIIIDCFTENEATATYHPIKKSSHFIPDWWKNLKPTHTIIDDITGVKHEYGTMRGCPGFIELYKYGMIIPMWSDLKIQVNEARYTYQFALNECSILQHHTYQHNDSFKEKMNLKITSPWLLKEKTGVKFLYSACTWTSIRLFPELTVLPGILDFKYQKGTHINSFIPFGKPSYEISIEAGTPMAQLIPISEHKVEPKIHTVSDVEYRQMVRTEWQNKFVKSYINRINPKAPK